MDAGQGRPFHLDAALVAALCAGVTLQLLWPSLLPVGAAIAGLVLVILALIVLRHRQGPRLFAAAIVGVALCALHGHAALSQRLPPGDDGRPVVVEATVVGLPESGPRGSRFAVEVVRVLDGMPGRPDALEGRRVDLRWYGGGRALRPGERWRWSLRLASLNGPMNPGDPDASRRALVDRTVAAATVSTGVRPLRLAGPRGLHALRDAVGGRIRGALGNERGRFVAALAVGDTRGLADADWERLRRFGLTHLIAISGFHVGLVAGLGVLVVRLAWWLWPTLAHRWRRPQASAFGATVAALAYAALAGFSLPTIRTVFMVAAVSAVVGLRLKTPPAQGLLLAVAVIALVDPLALLTPGFWLSCGGVAWLMWCLPRSTRAFDARAYLSAQWVATLGLMPIAAAFFLQVPILGPVANLVAIPWISLVVVPLSLLGTLLSPVSAAAAAMSWSVAAGAMDLLWWGLEAVPSAWAGIHWVPTPAPWAVGLAALGVAIALLPRGVAGRQAGWLLILPLLAPRLPEVPPGEFRITVFAIDRGDAVLVQTRSRNVLVDAGPAYVDLAASLRALGIDAIDLRVQTRGNAGRADGVVRVDAAFPPRQVWQGPDGPSGERCEAGRVWRADGVIVEAVSPSPDGGGREADHACVLRMVDANGREVWMASEAGRWVARRLASASTRPAPPWIVGSPVALSDWLAAFEGAGAIATRAPGPSLARAWRSGLHRVDLEGALRWSPSTEGEGATAAVRPVSDTMRWWHPSHPSTPH